jgi:uroporphyrinogen decarboxylase
MNSTERVHAALTGTTPDRVPLVEMLVDPKVAAALVPQAADMAEAMDQLGLDCVPASAAFPPVTTEGDYYVDEWGVTYKRSEHVLSHPLKPALRGPDDLLAWMPPDPDAPHRLEALRRNVDRYKGQRAIFFHHRAAFMHSVYLLGMDRLLEAFYTEPEFVHELMERVVAVNERVIRNAVRAGAEVICIADDYASNFAPMFSPAHFREFVLPRLQRIVDAVHDEGALAIKHSDGNLWPILDGIVDTGVDGLNPIEPMAGMDLGEVKAAFGERVCLVGNIDCGELLCHGTAAEVEAAVAEAMRVAKPGGRYMMSCSNSIHAGVKPENFRTMLEAGRRYGGYG